MLCILLGSVHPGEVRFTGETLENGDEAADNSHSNDFYVLSSGEFIALFSVSGSSGRFSMVFAKDTKLQKFYL